MNNIIPFKKSIIFKTKIADVTDISLTHDYRVMDELVEGSFTLSGTYKMTEASVINEEFYYNLPFSIAMSDRIDKSTVVINIDDFKYSFKDDILSINVDLNMKYEEVIEEETESIEEVLESIRGNDEDEDVKEIEEEIKEEIKDYNINTEIPTTLNPQKENVDVNNVVNNILSDMNEVNEYTTYKVHIVRSDDSLESIANKYSISLDKLKEYNPIETINIGDKVLVPFIYNE